MIGFPGSKINFGLRVLRRRADGYHDLRSVFIPIGLSDILEIVHSDIFEFSSSGHQLSGDQTDNLVVRAFRLIEQKFSIGCVKIHLHKIIPEGSGLGGGSADGAKTLEMLDAIFNLKLEIQQLRDIALQLGSDCPFFIRPETMKVEGRGEQLTPFKNPLSGKQVLLIRPPVSIPTNEAFSLINPFESSDYTKTLTIADIPTLKGIVVNDFESSAFTRYPILQEIKTWHYTHGALYASMSGSGSAVYGIYDFLPMARFAESFYWSGRIE